MIKRVLWGTLFASFIYNACKNRKEKIREEQRGRDREVKSLKSTSHRFTCNKTHHCLVLSYIILHPNKNLRNNTLRCTYTQILWTIRDIFSSLWLIVLNIVISPIAIMGNPSAVFGSVARGRSINGMFLFFASWVSYILFIFALNPSYSIVKLSPLTNF